jgi:hypothetical protein
MPRPGINGACQIAGRFNRAVVAFLAMGPAHWCGFCASPIPRTRPMSRPIRS